MKMPLALNPRGGLLLEESNVGKEAQRFPDEVEWREAFAESSARGLLMLAVRRDKTPRRWGFE